MIRVQQLNEAEALTAHTQLVEKLYSKRKPNSINLSKAVVNLAVFGGDEIQALASLFCNDSFENVLMVGNYECVDSQDLAELLFESISEKAIQLKKFDVIGPMHGDTWNSYRYSLLPKTNFFMEYLHQPYYADQWQKAGFKIWAQYQTNIEIIHEDTVQADPDAYFLSKGLTIRSFDGDNSLTELKKIHSFCSKSFADNFLYSPITEDEFLRMYKPFFPYLKPELIDLVFDNEKMVGLFFAIDNLYATNEVIVKTIARDLSENYKGLIHHLAANFLRKVKKMGYQSMLHAYFHLDNKSSRVSKNYDGQIYQQHALFKKNLQ